MSGGKNSVIASEAKPSRIKRWIASSADGLLAMTMKQERAAHD